MRVRVFTALLIGMTVLVSCKPRSEGDVTMTHGQLLSANSTLRHLFVALRIPLKNGRMGHCSGVLIGPRHVLTSAHCFDDAARVDVVTFDSRLEETAWKTASWKVFPSFAAFRAEPDLKAVASDLAVVVTNQNVSTRWAQIEVADRERWNDLRYVGAGRIEGEKRDGKPRISQKVAGARKLQPGVGATWLSKSSSLICGGDSGGPLFTSEGRLLGIASSVGFEKKVVDTCGAGDVVYHTDVRAQIKWIACSFRSWGVPLPGFENPSCS